ncbi:H-NS family nucleoid-associated regulatory protein [Paraburkholderia lacunae]|uniref:DNA-binding protein n=1 Tax=Paraburkholderia lacunae TaxID=2211104 RepID=A0A370N9W6_9BURK|nr:H-NS histone family protein [Paraburkholderia lacunae]RDK02410.1 DNA-binding protein [Paraburkholderia lacunae]
MSTYKALREQIERLTQKAEAARAVELQAVIAEIRARVSEYGLTEKDIFPPRRGRPAKTAKPVAAPKYRDPKTGQTWSGRGRTPAWLKSKDRGRFLIKG